MPSERVAVFAVSGVPEVQVGQDLDGELLLHVCVRVLALRRRARGQRVVAAGPRDAERTGNKHTKTCHNRSL